MTTIVGITDHDNLIKEIESAAVLAADVSAFQQHLQRRKMQADTQQRLDALEQKVNQTFDIISQIAAHLNVKL